MNYSYGQVKGVNPAREVWGANYNASSPCTSYPAEQLNNVGLHEDNNVGVGTSSAFYSPNPSSYNSKIKRPWVSPGSLEPSRLMLNNQVAPGNRTNNYWDNFRRYLIIILARVANEYSVMLMFVCKLMN